MTIRQRIEGILTAMSRGAYEREEVIGLSLLSVLSGESIFLLGLPGVGKSMVARRLKQAFLEGSSFKYLMSRFSTPDEIFGPVSISKLKDEDIYERAVEGYLPTADIVFLDEIWKAGPAIQNSLLTVLNEKLFRNGKEDLHLPLKAVISASNELPAEGEGLEAIWDRFLIRYIVKPIADKDLFMTLICGSEENCQIPSDLQLSNSELEEIRQISQSISVPNSILETIYSIRKTLIDEKKAQSEGVDVTKSDIVEPPYVSDRRWKKIVKLMKTSAYLNGRDQVDYSDCLLMDHMLWDNDEQINSVEKLVSTAIATNIRQNGMPDMIDRLQRKRYSKPVGQPISPDGIHYIFKVGDEEMLISKSDYESLPMDHSVYGLMTEDDKLILTDSPTSLSIRKTTDGLSVNSFSYPLKRDSILQSSTTKSIMDEVSKNVDKLEEIIRDMVNDNIFIPSYSRFYSLRKAFTEVKGQIIRNGF